MKNKPVTSKPQYPIPWIATYFIAALVLIAGAFSVTWFFSGEISRFDYDNPDIQFLERIVQSANPGLGDFSSFNGGDWTLLCLIGSQGDDSQGDVTALSSVKGADAAAGAIRAALKQAPRELDGSEFAALYVTGAGEVRSVHHPHGFAFVRGLKAKCITPGHSVLKLPVLP